MARWFPKGDREANFYIANLMIYFKGPEEHEDGAKHANRFGKVWMGQF